MKKLLLIMILALIISCGKKDEELEKAKRDAEIEQKVEEKMNEMAAEEKKTEKKDSSQNTSKPKASSGDYREKLIARTKSMDSQYNKITSDSNDIYDNIDEINSLGEKWDTELNKVYQLLMSKLSENKKQELKTEQRKWIKDRDKEIEATGDNLVQADLFYNLTKERTLELASLYDKL